MRIPAVVSRNLDAVHHRMIDILKVLNGGISLGDGAAYQNANIVADTPLPAGNMAGVIVVHTFGAPNTPVAITHNLNRVPVGYIAVEKTAATDVFDGNVANWSSTTIELQATVATKVKLYVY